MTAAPTLPPQMFPIMLDVSAVPILVIGDDEGALGRVRSLQEHGAKAVALFAPGIVPDVPVAHVARWPTADDFRLHAPKLVFITIAPDHVLSTVHALARDSGALVHSQDRIPYCDFHLPARLRRGRLLVTVSTDGAVAGLSRLLRDYLADHVFGAEWAARVDELAEARKGWKARGLSMGTLFAAIKDFVTARRWLGDDPQNSKAA